MALRRIRWTGLVISALVLGASFVMAGQPAGASPPKPFAASVAASTVGAGDTVQLTLTITNDARPQPLGSANLTAATNADHSSSVTLLSTNGTLLLGGNPASPIGTATLAGSVIQIRNLSLPPGQFATLSFTAQAPCGGGPLTWGIAAKQSNDFNGTGNDFVLEGPPASNLTETLTGACKLVFLSSPADANATSGITTSAFDPSGSPIQVAVQSGSGSLVTSSSAPVQLAVGTVPPGGTSTLGGTTLVNAVGGVATFCSTNGCSLPSLASHGQGYTLSASSAGMDSGASSAFNVVDDGTVCRNPGQCQVQSKLVDTTGQVSVTAAPGDLLSISIGVDSLACAGYATTSQIVTFTSTAASVSTVTITIDAASVNKAPSQFQVCFSSSLSFTDRTGNVVPPGGSGLLADCSKKVSAPCTVSRSKDKAGNISLVMQAPPGDPRVGG
jgi:hypothetical protein